jgi:hypothetical protein
MKAKVRQTEVEMERDRREDRDGSRDIDRKTGTEVERQI